MEKVMEPHLLDEKSDGKSIAKYRWMPTRAPWLIWDFFWSLSSEVLSKIGIDMLLQVF